MYIDGCRLLSSTTLQYPVVQNVLSACSAMIPELAHLLVLQLDASTKILITLRREALLATWDCIVESSTHSTLSDKQYGGKACSGYDRQPSPPRYQSTLLSASRPTSEIKSPSSQTILVALLHGKISLVTRMSCRLPATKARCETVADVRSLVTTLTYNAISQCIMVITPVPRVLKSVGMDRHIWKDIT
ncbi:hypothetical protein MRB53_037848 [Persea americana]|nr:hypothetical protein MRB53_037848 [Persea americana]